jgi:hypothetical protein
LILTPKAFANLSPGLERSDNPGIQITNQVVTLKGFLLPFSSSEVLTLSESVALLVIAEVASREKAIAQCSSTSFLAVPPSAFFATT